jgi:hypothetical protein
MSLLERIERSRTRIDALQALKKRATQAADFEQRANTLSSIAASLAILETPSAVLQQAGIRVPELDRALMSQLHLKAVQLRDGYKVDRANILNPFPGNDAKFVFFNPSNTFKQRTEEAFRNAWSEWVQRRMPAIDQEVLSVLAGVNALRTAVAKVQTLLGQIKSCIQKLPQSKEDVDQVVLLCADANRDWHELAGDGIDPEVLAFLRVAGSADGAAYDLLTPSILEWIEAHGLRRVLRIRLG